MSITAFENLLSTAERRMLLSNTDRTHVRLSDFMGIIPSITGKIELVYEGEQEGADFVAETLLEKAIQHIFPKFFPKIDKLEKKGEITPYDDLIAWFFESEGFELFDEDADETYFKKLNAITPLNDLIATHGSSIAPSDHPFLKELLLWGLVTHKKLSKYRFQNGVRFKDLYGGYISEL